jgi:DNA-binding MarR family transcriptional regulator
MSDLYSLPGHLLWRSQARVAAEISRLLPGRSDLHAYAALLALAQVEPQSQQGLATMTGVSGTTMTVVAEALERDGLVERIRNPADRRSYALTRTTAGRDAVHRWEPDVRALEDRLSAPLSKDEVARLRTHLFTLVGDRLDENTPQALLDSIGFVINRTHQRMHREFLAALEPLGIEPRHFGTLRALRAAGPVTQGQLAELLDVSPALVVQIVDHLEEHGLVARERDPADRRAYRLHLLPAAEPVITDASRIAATVHDERYGGPRSRDRADLVRLLQKFLSSPGSG